MTGDHDWQAGTASVSITPDREIGMAGFAAREGPSEGTAQELEATAVALAAGDGDRVVLVGADIIGIPRERRVAVADRCRADYGLAPEGLLLSASHTHSGPEIRPERARMDNWGTHLDADRIAAYADRFEDAIVGLVGAALEDLAPAAVGYSHGHAGFGLNRRHVVDGEPRARKTTDGPVDHVVPVLRVDDADGAPDALVFGYACHNTTVSDNAFSGDWTGHAKATLRERFPGATPVFLTGCAADVNPRPRGTADDAREHGATMANAVEAAAVAGSGSTGWPPSIRALSGAVGRAYGTVTVDYRTVPDRAALEDRLEAEEAAVRNHADYLLGRLDREGSLPADYDYPVQTLRLGDLTLVALAGEVPVAVGHRLREELDGTVWPAAYANDQVGYVPTPRILQEGGYEADGWVRYSSHPDTFDYSSEERIVAAVRRLAAGTGGSPSR